MKTIKVYYNKTLGMSEGKIPSQCCHAVADLVAQIGYDRDTKIIILEARATKFFDLYDQQKKQTDVYMQVGLVHLVELNMIVT
jgi:peptidyl-tRNA hydrolase